MNITGKRFISTREFRWDQEEEKVPNPYFGLPAICIGDYGSYTMSGLDCYIAIEIPEDSKFTEELREWAREQVELCFYGDERDENLPEYKYRNPDKYLLIECEKKFLKATV